MIIGKLIQTASIGATVFIMAAGASAGPITYTTNTTTPTPTAFVAGNICISGCPSSPDDLTVDSTSGAASQLEFTPNTSSVSGTPSNIDLGDFVLTCPTCGTTQSTFYSGFTFDLVVTDTTDGGATGEFVGTSSGGTVSSNSSTIDITWSTVPVNSLDLGPGTSNSLSGNFGITRFTISNPTQIVAINSGSNQGETTVQGTVSSGPEPATFSMMGGGLLLGLGVFRRKRFFRS